jgi:hypothetical protein
VRKKENVFPRKKISLTHTVFFFCSRVIAFDVSPVNFPVLDAWMGNFWFVVDNQCGTKVLDEELRSQSKKNADFHVS